MTLCPGHRESVAGARRAISHHRRRKIARQIAAHLAAQCPDCIRATKESK